MTELRTKYENISKNKVKTDKMIIKAKSVLRLLRTVEIKVRQKSDFTSLSLLRGNLVGNLIRSSKLSSVNKNLDKSQEAILNLHRDLLIFDENLAKILYLPTKITQYSTVRGKLADIAFRTNLRLKAKDISKAKRSVEKIIRRLEATSRRYAYDIKKYQELKEL